MPTPYTRLTTAALNTLNSSTLGSLQPYQLSQVMEFLGRVAWGKANSSSGEGSQSNMANQPTLANIVTLLNGQNV